MTVIKPENVVLISNKTSGPCPIDAKISDIKFNELKNFEDKWTLLNGIGHGANNKIYTCKPISNNSKKTYIVRLSREESKYNEKLVKKDINLHIDLSQHNITPKVYFVGNDYNGKLCTVMEKYMINAKKYVLKIMDWAQNEGITRIFIHSLINKIEQKILQIAELGICNFDTKLANFVLNYDKKTMLINDIRLIDIDFHYINYDKNRPSRQITEMYEIMLFTLFMFSHSCIFGWEVMRKLSRSFDLRTIVEHENLRSEVWEYQVGMCKKNPSDHPDPNDSVDMKIKTPCMCQYWTFSEFVESVGNKILEIDDEHYERTFEDIVLIYSKFLSCNSEESYAKMLSKFFHKRYSFDKFCKENKEVMKKLFDLGPNSNEKIMDYFPCEEGKKRKISGKKYVYVGEKDSLISFIPKPEEMSDDEFYSFDHSSLPVFEISKCNQIMRKGTNFRDYMRKISSDNKLGEIDIQNTKKKKVKYDIERLTDKEITVKSPILLTQ